MIVVVRRNPADAVPAAEFPVTALDAAGDTLWTTRVPYAPVPFSQQVVDSVLDGFAQQIAESGRFGLSAAEARSLYADALYRPPTWSPVSSVLVATGNRVWLRREDIPADSSRWLVLDSQGAPEAELTVPAGARLRYIDGDVVWAVEQDVFDVQYVVRYRLQRE